MPLLRKHPRAPEELLACFDVAADGQGGRAPTLRRLTDQAATGPPAPSGRLLAHPLKLTVRLAADDGEGVAREGAGMGLTRNGWRPRSSAIACRQTDLSAG